MAVEECPESYELKGVVRAIQLTAIDSLEVDGSKVYGTGGGDEAGVELSWLADRCGVHEDGLRSWLDTDEHAYAVPDESSVARGVIDKLRESQDVKLPAAPSMADVSRRTGIPEEWLDEALDESYEFAVRAAGLSPPDYDLRRRAAEAVNLLSDSRKAPTRKAVSEDTGIYKSKITEVAENDYPDLTRRQGQIPNSNRIAGDYMEAYDLIYTSDHPVTIGAVRDMTPSTDLDQAESVLTHSQAREKTGLDPLPEVPDDNQASEASEYVDAVARQMDRDSAFEVHETNRKKNQSSVSFSACGGDYVLVFVDAGGRTITNMMSSEEGESYEGDPPSGSPRELVSDVRDKLG